MYAKLTIRDACTVRAKWWVTLVVVHFCVFICITARVHGESNMVKENPSTNTASTDASSKNHPPPLATITNTHRYYLRSEKIGETFVIDVALPLIPQKETDEPLPVIYLTDGNLNFPMVTSTLRFMQLGGELPPAILVGIGYQNEAEVMVLRSRDLTPTEVKNFDNLGTSVMPDGFETGKADDFLDFIEKQVKPLIANNYAVHTGEDTLMGDSLGGLFTLYALFTRAQEYKNYVVGSPSLWWDDKVMLKIEEEYSKTNDDLAGNVFISVGGYEQNGKAAQPYQMISNMHKFSDQLTQRNYPSLRLEKYEFEKETHLSVIPATFSRGMRVVLTGK